jgi:hypothetical protein
MLKDRVFNKLDSIATVKAKRYYMFNSKLTQYLGNGNKVRWWEEYIFAYRQNLMNGIVRDTLQCLYQPTNTQYINEMLD